MSEVTKKTETPAVKTEQVGSTTERNKETPQPDSPLTSRIRNTELDWISPGKFFTVLSWFVIIMLGIMIFIYFVLWSNDARLLALITFGGFGGILYDLSDVDTDKKTSRFEGIIQFPGVKRNDKDQITEMRLGWISHALFGIAGALVIFLVVPIDNTTTVQADTVNLTLTWDIRTLAFALVGGYGGRALLPTLADGYLKRAAKQVAEETKAETQKQIEEVKQTAQQATKTAQDAQKIAEEQKTGLHATVTEEELRQREELNATTLANIKEHLEPDNSVNPELVAKIRETLPKVSPTIRVEAFELARKYRHDYWNGTPEEKQLMERAIPIFEGLIAADTEGRFSRNYGQLAYITRDKIPPDYAKAIEYFDKAIEIRNNTNDSNQYPLYNIMRAISRVALVQQQSGAPDQLSSESIVNMVLDDLRRGRDIAIFDSNENAIMLSKGIGDSEDVNKLAHWFEVNNIDPETLNRIAVG